jgi:hypothetical protein
MSVAIPACLCGSKIYRSVGYATTARPPATKVCRSGAALPLKTGPSRDKTSYGEVEAGKTVGCRLCSSRMYRSDAQCRGRWGAMEFPHMTMCDNVDAVVGKRDTHLRYAGDVSTLLGVRCTMHVYVSGLME